MKNNNLGRLCRKKLYYAGNVSENIRFYLSFFSIMDYILMKYSVNTTAYLRYTN